MEHHSNNTRVTSSHPTPPNVPICQLRTIYHGVKGLPICPSHFILDTLTGYLVLYLPRSCRLNTSMRSAGRTSSIRRIWKAERIYAYTQQMLIDCQGPYDNHCSADSNRNVIRALQSTCVPLLCFRRRDEYINDDSGCSGQRRGTEGACSPFPDKREQRSGSISFRGLQFATVYVLRRFSLRLRLTALYALSQPSN